MSWLWKWMCLALFFCVALGEITFKDYGYSNVTIYIGKADEKDAESIISNITEVVTKASQVLSVATRNKAYFKDVRIVIPSNWTKVKINGFKIGKLREFEEPEIIVTNDTKPYPWVEQPDGCGIPGEVMYLPVDFVLKSKHNIIKSAKIFVHEWAHLRYGVFNEYGTDEDDYPEFYASPDNSKPLPNVCMNIKPSFITANKTTGKECDIDPRTGVYYKNCSVIWNADFKPSTSLASNLFDLESVMYFCNDSNHNSNLTNKHNTQCDGKSVWSVIQQHPDFQNLKGPVAVKRKDPDTKPKFEIVRARNRTTNRYVLALDVSYSMYPEDRMERLREAATRWLQQDVPIGDEVGIVKFSFKASTTAAIKEITRDEVRQELIDKLPNKQSVETSSCIACGLEWAAKMLEKKGEGGTILLITDGMNSPGLLSVDDVIPHLKHKKIRVNTIAIGENADIIIEKLADETGGKSYFVPDMKPAGLASALMSSTFQAGINSRGLVVEVYRNEIKFTSLTHEAEFKIDSTATKNLKFVIIGVKKHEIRAIGLISPTKEVYNKVVYGSSTATIQVNTTKPGKWKYEIKLKQIPNDQSTIIITAEPNSTLTISTTCKISNGGNVQSPSKNPVKIVAFVKLGNSPVVGARVFALIHKPDNSRDIIRLRDNGANADTTAGDGIYTANYAEPNLKGRYSVLCQVSNYREAYITDGFIGSAAIDTDYNYNNKSKQIMEPFTRFASAGSFRVDDPVPKEDPYPPGRVTDLKSINSAIHDMVVTLEWTAPGDDLDMGKAAYYEVKYSNSMNKLKDFTSEQDLNILTMDDVIEGSLEPLEAGEVQRVSFHLPKDADTQTYFVALRAVDKENKRGAISNFVPVHIPKKMTWQSKDIVTVQMESMNFQFSTIVWICILLAVPVVVIVAFLIIKRTARTRHYTRGLKV